MARCKVGELAIIIGSHCDCMTENIGKIVTCEVFYSPPDLGEWWTVRHKEAVLLDHPPHFPFTFVGLPIALHKDEHLMPIRPSPEAESRDTHQDISVDDSAPKVKEKETA